MSTERSLRIASRTVKQVALVEDLRLGGVQVLGVIVAKGTRPEADDPTAPVGDRKGDPASKTFPPSRRKKTRRTENLPVEPQLRRCLDNTRDTTGRSVPQTKFFDSRKRNSAAFQVVSGVFGFGRSGLQEVFVIVDGRCGERFVDVAAAKVSFSGGFGISSTLEVQLDAGALGQVGDGVNE
jgi:hypothetical protein